MIMAIDKDDMLGAIKSFPKQCRDALSLPQGISVSGNIKKIVVAGMGGSAIGGDLLKAFMEDSMVPVYVSRSYKVPGFVDSNTLVFIVSYSGNTEETYSSYLDAYEKKAKIIAITSGGKIADEAEKVIKMTDSKSKIVYKEPLLFMTPLGVPNISLAKERLSWFPVVLLDEGLNGAIDYFRAHKAHLGPTSVVDYK